MESKIELLDSLQYIVENPTPERPLRDWVGENLTNIEAFLDRRDYLKLKRRGLIGALSVLERHGKIEPTEFESTPIDYSEKHCRYCGNDLFWVLPGKTSRDDIIEYAQRIGDEQIAADAWIHPGVYCPNGCTFVLFNIARNSDPETTSSENDG